MDTGDDEEQMMKRVATAVRQDQPRRTKVAVAEESRANLALLQSKVRTLEVTYAAAGLDHANLELDKGTRGEGKAWRLFNREGQPVTAGNGFLGLNARQACETLDAMIDALAFMCRSQRQRSHHA